MSQHHLPWSVQWGQKQQKDKEKEKSFNVVDLTVMGDIIKTKAKVVEFYTQHNSSKKLCYAGRALCIKDKKEVVDMPLAQI